MLYLRLTVDAKCPKHPRRSYAVKPAGCGICQAIVEAATLADRATRELRAAFRLGADLRWKNIRRSRKDAFSAARLSPSESFQG